MKIAIDVSPLQTGHKVRGVGFYLSQLKKALEKTYPEESYEFFTDRPQGIADVVHYPYFEPFARSQPIPTKKNMVTTIHDLTPIRFPEHFPAGMRGSLYWQLQRFLVKQSGAIITDSEHSKKDIVELLSVSESFVHVAYLAAGEEFKRVQSSKSKIQSLKEKYTLPEKFVLYVGDVTWNKNLPRVIRAAIQAEVPLVLVGKAITQTDFDRQNPWNRDRIEIHELLKTAKQVYALGFVETDDLVALYNMAAVSVFPSLYEGFGLPVLESMQSGCPVITSREASLPEVAGDAAYYVDAYSEENIAKGIREVFHSDSLQKKLSEKGQKQAAQFSWEKCARDTYRVYEKVYRSSKK